MPPRSTLPARPDQSAPSAPEAHDIVIDSPCGDLRAHGILLSRGPDGWYLRVPGPLDTEVVAPLTDDAPSDWTTWLRGLTGDRPLDMHPRSDAPMPPATEGPEGDADALPRGRRIAADAIADYLRTQVAVVVGGHVRLRRGLDPVHDVRVALRRLRSILREGASLFGDPADAHALEHEISWYAGLLGGVRDRAVQRPRLRAALDTLDPALVRGPVRERLDADLLSEQFQHRDLAIAALDSERYATLVETLTRWAVAPPVSHDTTRSALRAIADGADRRAHVRLRRAASKHSDDETVHRARKAVKRARYVSEMASPVRHPARAKRHAAIQDLLGEHHDAAVAADTILRLAAAAAAAGEETFTYGLLYSEQRRRADSAHARLRDTV